MIEPKHRTTEVWLAAFANVDNFKDRNSTNISYNIRDFFIQLIDYCNSCYDKYSEFVVFFHNLKFDGSFILNFFLKEQIPFKSFINGMGVWYSITIDFGEYKITFRDSLKVLNFKLSVLAEIFETEQPKGETPLLEYKPEAIEKEWLEYIRTDIQILSTAIYTMYKIEGFTMFTGASEALKQFKGTIQNYRKLFQILPKETDTYIRAAYSGGWTFPNPIYQNRIIEEDIVVYDQNSMYPSVMLNYEMPYDRPEYIEGEPKDNYYYVADIWLCAELNNGYLPTIQAKTLDVALSLGIKRRDYITSTNGIYIRLHLTNYDIELIKKHYDCDIKFISHYKFKSKKGIFDEYINKYKYIKENARTLAEKTKAKNMLNSLYGKFGSKIFTIRKEAYLEDNVLKLKNCEPEEVKPNYIPLAVFITSISRYKIITDAQNNFDNFLYSDTDSLHLIKSDTIDLEIDKNEFGKWKLEGEYDKAKYLRPKLYIESKGDKMDVKGAGMTDEVKEQITYDNFKIDAKFKGKRATKQVNGGVIIYDTEFTIRDTDLFNG